MFQVKQQGKALLFIGHSLCKPKIMEEVHRLEYARPFHETVAGDFGAAEQGFLVGPMSRVPTSINGLAKAQESNHCFAETAS